MDLATREEIRRHGLALGFDLVGFAGAEVFEAEAKVLGDRSAQGHRTPFEEPDVGLRTDPRRWLPGARSIIAVAIGYGAEGGHVAPPGGPRGFVSSHARGIDYHRLLREGLRRLADYLERSFPGVQIATLVDTGPAVDRAVAARAGLGWFGRNCSIITPQFGSMVYLGELVTDLDLPPDGPAEGSCGTCTRCLDACPTGALVEAHVTNGNVCLSYITQRRGIMDPAFRVALGNRLYGCDTCQDVCPFNVRFTAPAALADPDGFPLLADVLAMDNRSFGRAFGPTAAGWRGRTTLQRNAVVALGNSRDPGAVVILEALMDDPRPVIRVHVAWALGRLGGPRAWHLLQRWSTLERDPSVASEIHSAMAGLDQETLRVAHP